jgi:hypothetical protein
MILKDVDVIMGAGYVHYPVHIITPFEAIIG